MAITPTQIDSQSLNSTEGIRTFIVRNTSAGDFVATTTKRTRNRLTPSITNETFETRKRVVHISPDPAIIDTSDPIAVEEFDATVHNIFLPWAGQRTLYGENHNGESFYTPIRITRFGRRSPHEYEAEFEFVDAVWKSSTLNSTTSSPITVGGNVFAQPVITISSAVSITRTRLTITDRTGHGIMGHMISVASLGGAAADHIVYMNGIEIPFTLDFGRLYFRIAAPPPNGSGATSTFVDIFYGPSLNNTTTANQLDNANITLDSGIASGAYTTDPSNPFGNALSSSLSWHPGIVTRHPQSRGYTFGFDGENQIRLVDRSATGTQYNLPDDADAYILTSPVEIDSISDLSFKVDTEWVPGRQSFYGTSTEKVMKVTIATIDGSSIPDAAPHISDAGFQASIDALAGSFNNYPFARQDYLFYSQFTFGDVTFPDTWSYDFRNASFLSGSIISMTGNPDYDGSFARGIVWYNDYLPWEIGTLAQQYIGCTVTTGEEGVWYLHFPEGSFRDVEELPLLSMSLHEKPGGFTMANNDPGQDDVEVIIHGATDLNDILLFNSEWVDPDTLEPLDNNSDPDAPSNEFPLFGTVNAFVAKRTRDSEDWQIVWEEQLTATAEEELNRRYEPESTTISVTNLSATFTPTDLTGLNAVQIAVGIKPSSTQPNTVDSGTLTITTNPVINLVSGRMPNISSDSGLPAQLMSGVLTNTTNNKYIELENVVGNGLEIDTANLTMQAVSGPFYGRIKTNGGTRLLDLAVGSNTWTWTGAGTVTFEWYNREAE